MPIRYVPLAALLPDADLPDGTVTLEDARLLSADLLLYGNAFVIPTGEAEPTHVRVKPTEVSPAS
jgi:hypothetical protein